MRFEASWDSSVWLWTWGSMTMLVFAVAMLVHAYIVLSRKGRRIKWFVVALAVVVACIPVYAALSAPRYYVLTQDALVVERMIGARSFVFGQNTDIISLQGDSLRGGTRLFGSGGLFGYYGTFHHRDLGRYYLAATKRDNRILLQDSAHAAIVTPDDVLGFLEEARRRFGFSTK